MANHAKGSTWTLRALQFLFVVVLATGLALGSWIGWFYWHSEHGGAALLKQVRFRITKDDLSGAHVNCTSPTGAVAELIIPSLQLIAPVVEGDGDTQLADAVGHVPTSVWPGGPGAPVLVAHDVTWFHGLSSLQAGQDVEYVSGCKALVYKVKSSQVVSQGTAVPNSPGSLALVTCWPLDALWFTGQRLLVVANEVGGSASAPAVSIPLASDVPPIAVPPDLTGDDTLAANPTPLGTLTESGSPSPTFSESPGPLADVAAAQDVYFAALRAAEGGAIGDWSYIAPGVSINAAGVLQGASLEDYPQPLSTILRVDGEQLTGASISVEVELSGSEPGTWNVSVTEGIVNGALAITGWQMEPVGS